MRVIKLFILLSFITIKWVSAACTSEEVNDTETSSCITKEVCKQTKFLSNDETECVITCSTLYDMITRKCMLTLDDCTNYLVNIENESAKKCEQACPSGQIEDVINQGSHPYKSCILQENCNNFLSSDKKQCIQACGQNEISDSTQTPHACLDSESKCQNYLSFDRKSCIAQCAQGEFRVESTPKKCFDKEEECRNEVSSGSNMCIQRCTSDQSLDEITPDSHVKSCLSKTQCKGVVIEGNPSEYTCQSKCPNGKLPYIETGIDYKTCKDTSSCLLSLEKNACVQQCNASKEIRDNGFTPNVCISKTMCPLISNDGLTCVRQCQNSTEVINLSTTPQSCMTKTSCNLLSINGEECVSSCPPGTFQKKLGQTSQHQCVLSCREQIIASDNLTCVDSCVTGEVINTTTNSSKNCINQENCTFTISLDGKYCNKSCINNTEVRDGRVQNQPNKCILKTDCTGAKTMIVQKADQQEYCLLCSVKSCQTCKVNDETKCDVCNAPLYLNLDDFTCKQFCEPNEYYNSTTKTCKSCSQYCQECLSDSQCNTCEGTADKINGICYQKCSSNQYRDTQDHTCKGCHSSCLTCESNTDNSCLTCQPNLYYSSTQKTCTSVCLDGFSPSLDKKSCQQCTVTECSACKFTGVSSSICNLCKSGFLLNEDINQCVTSCPSDYTPDAQNKKCIKCQTPCSTCQTTSTHCLTCVQDFYLHNSNECVDSCPKGTYDALDQNSVPVCKTCRVGCSACYSDVSCTECSDTYYLGLDANKNKICMQTCPSSTYADPIKKSCESCIPLCLNCTNGTSCGKCKSNYYLHNNAQCLTQCPTSFYPDSNDFTCKSCSNNCEKCNASSCQKCKSGFVLQGNQCLDKCNDGYFINDSVCEQCSGNCSSCTNQLLCQACNDPYFLENDGCVLNCSVGKYKKLPEKICDSCFTNCQECQDKVTCSQCSNNFYLHIASDNSQTCVSLCPKGTFTNTQNKTCDKCITNCQKCSNGTTCEICNNNLFLSSTKTSCLTQCPEQHYTNNDLNQCEKCHDTCKSCSGTSNNQCLSCFKSTTPPDSDSPYNNYFFYNNECLAQCPANTFSDSNSNCQHCISGCEVCNSTTSCESCSGNLIKYKNEQGVDSCQSTCPDFYFIQTTPIKQCEKCLTHCQKCQNSSGCDACESGYYFENNTCSPCSQKFGQNCLTCTPQNNPLDSSVCIECKAGFQFSSQNQKCEPIISMSLDLNNSLNVYELKKSIDSNLVITSAYVCLVFNGQQTCQSSTTDKNMQITYDQTTFKNLNEAFMKILPQPLKAQVKLTVKDYGDVNYEFPINENSTPQISSYKQMLELLFNANKIYENSTPKVILPQVYNMRQRLNQKAQCTVQNVSSVCQQLDSAATCVDQVCICSEDFDGSDCTLNTITLLKNNSKLLKDLLAFYSDQQEQQNYLRVQVSPSLIVSPVEFLQQSQSLLAISKNTECNLQTKSQAKTNAKGLLWRAISKKTIADSVASAEEQGQLTHAIQNIVEVYQLNNEEYTDNNKQMQIIIKNMKNNGQNSYLSCTQVIDQNNNITNENLFQDNTEDKQCQSSASRKVTSVSIVNDKTVQIISSLDMLTSPKLQISYVFSSEQTSLRFLSSSTDANQSSSKILNKATFQIDNLKQQKPSQIACVTYDDEKSEFVASESRIVDLMNQTISCLYYDNVSLVVDDECKFLSSESCSSEESSSGLSTSQILIVVGSITGAVVFIFIVIYALRARFQKQQQAKEQQKIEQSQITEINLQKRIKTELAEFEEKDQL